MSTYDYIIAFDPGETTGYAIYDKRDDSQFAVITIGDFPNFTEIDQLIYEKCIVIVERPFARPSTNLVVFEVKGTIMERAARYNAYLAWQSAYIPTFVESKYESMTSNGVKGSRHAKDALCHLLYYLNVTHKMHLPVADGLKLLRQ